MENLLLPFLTFLFTYFIDSWIKILSRRYYCRDQLKLAIKESKTHTAFIFATGTKVSW